MAMLGVQGDRMNPLAYAFAAALLATPALAQEIVRAGADGAPPMDDTVSAAPLDRAAATDAARDRAIGEWGKRVIAGQSTAELDAPAGDKPAAAKGCGNQPANDGKPHGQVWAGVGTHGYRNIGGVVTQPIGQCGSLTLAIDKTEGDFGRRRR